jgi:hypothetical protein
MSGVLSQHGKRRVFILGAGFNAPLVMPLTGDLLKQVHAVAARKTWRREPEQIRRGMADWLVEMVDWHYPLAGIDHKSIESGAALASFDPEEFLSFASSASTVFRSARWISSSMVNMGSPAHRRRPHD